MKCTSCGRGTMQNATTTYFAKLKSCYVIIENVPCLKCDECGEETFAASVAVKIDSILDSLEKVASKIFIMDYRQAA